MTSSPMYVNRIIMSWTITALCLSPCCVLILLKHRRYLPWISQEPRSPKVLKCKIWKAVWLVSTADWHVTSMSWKRTEDGHGGRTQTHIHAHTRFACAKCCIPAWGSSRILETFEINVCPNSPSSFVFHWRLIILVSTCSYHELCRCQFISPIQRSHHLNSIG